ncbi:hypothetical protein PV11_05258 [Exophiala sideris]|uniref:Uncharacterized protein n=1 Tax=Exophiala sideris TaxID=1016849 RepID=A0A0D1X657_9EURO|nr:hypothetical protein PV11_05258 [Exophiala sideris]
MESASVSLPTAAAEANTTPPPSPKPSIPDLSSLDANQLSKVPEYEARAIESSGEVYSDIFRRLQIRPDKYEEFYNGVLRFERNKHVAEVKRGTAASLTSVSRTLLRAFGYIVWAPSSEWLIDNSVLSEGEVRLTYSRKLGPDHPDNDRFYPILDDLWLRMRNVLFAQKPAPHPGRRRGRPAMGRPSAPPPPPNVDTEEDIYHSASTSHAAFERARATASRKLTALWETMPESDSLDRQYTYEECDEAILDLIVRLHEVRSRSDPRVFASLWEERIMRIDELEDVLPIDNNTQTQPATPDTLARNQMYLSNEPFHTHGRPILSNPSSIPPTMPSVMSIWISTSCLPTISLSASGLPNVIQTAAPPQQAYHWVDAPVENTDMTRFIQGVNWRIEPNASDIVGFVLSYGWNDITRFISTGRFETHEQTTGKQSGDGDAEHESEKEGKDVDVEMDMDSVVMPVEKMARHTGPDIDFPTHQWQVIGVGWRDFQNDLQDAARRGVKVWRMKIMTCVRV